MRVADVVLASRRRDRRGIGRVDDLYDMGSNTRSILLNLPSAARAVWVNLEASGAAGIDLFVGPGVSAVPICASLPVPIFLSQSACPNLPVPICLSQSACPNLPVPICLSQSAASQSAARPTCRPNQPVFQSRRLLPQSRAVSPPRSQSRSHAADAVEHRSQPRWNGRSATHQDAQANSTDAAIASSVAPVVPRLL